MTSGSDLLSTGAGALDRILGGGIPRQHSIIVTGAPGSGKTLLTSQIAFAHAQAGGRVVIASVTSESNDKLVYELRAFSFFDADKLGDEVFLLNAYPWVKKGPREAREIILSTVRDRGATLFVLDGMRAIRDVWNRETDLRDFLYELNVGLLAHRCTGIFTSEYPLPTLMQLPEATTLDGIIGLSTASIGQRRHRRIEVVKLRGRPHLLGDHHLRIDHHGVHVVPRLEVLADALAVAGYQCLRAHDGREALEAARQRRPDLIVTDHMMPRMTGVELLRALREDAALAQIPTILLSAVRPAGADLATRCLQKPIHVDDVRACVAELLEAPGTASTRATDPASHSATREEALNWVAHEIKNPLGVAVLNADLLLSHVTDAYGRKHLLSIKRQLGRMDELVMSVLDAARLEDGRVVLRRARTDLADLVERVVDEWRAHPHHTFELRVAARPIECDIDPERVRQIVDNLISNAVKYGGADRRVIVEVSLTDREAQVRVQDFGQGIAPADLQRIFDRFHRAKHGGRGHGLGLYIAAALARLHEGALTVDSKLGAGSTFLLSLPRPRAAAPPDDPATR